MVETLVATDQAIAINKIMEIAMAEREEFKCSDLGVDSANNLITYDNKTLVVFNRYATIEKVACEPNDGRDTGNIRVKIKVAVPQMPNKDFDIDIDYKYRISNMEYPVVLINVANGSYYTQTKDKSVTISISDVDGIRGREYKFKYAWSEKMVSCNKMSSTFTVNIPDGQTVFNENLTDMGKLTNINTTLNGKGTLYVCNDNDISDKIGNVLPTSIYYDSMWLDNTVPTCSLAIDKNTDKVTLTRSDTHSGIEKIGISTSDSVEYNGTSTADLAYSTFRGYVQDRAGLTNSCVLEIIEPTKTTCAKGYTKYTAKNKNIYCYK